MGKLLDWDNMPPAGTKVRFVGYVNGHEHWPYVTGKAYTICKNGKGDLAPADEQGHCPPRNFDNSFVFEIIDETTDRFTINKGDYIDSREFTREECERFCYIAMEYGFPMSEYSFNKEYGKYQFIGIGQLSRGGMVWFENANYYENYDGSTNITTKFREFLDKEKGMGKFTKDDLKDGMRCIDRDGDVWYVCGEYLFYKGGYDTRDIFESVSNWNEEFKHSSSCFNIAKIIDRDGTVMWEREEEPRELTIEEIAKAFNLPPERVRIKK